MKEKEELNNKVVFLDLDGTVPSNVITQVYEENKN